MKKKILIYYPGLKPKNTHIHRYSDSPNKKECLSKQNQIEHLPLVASRGMV